MNWVKSWILYLFWNSLEQRLRTLWRVALYSALWVMIQLVAAVVIRSPVTNILIVLFPAFSLIADALLFYLVNLLLVLGMTWLMIRHIDHRSWTDIGLHLDRAWFADFGFGLLLGIGLMTLIFLAELGLGWIRITDYLHTVLPQTPFHVAIWQPIFLFVAVGINEEILSRGYQLHNLAEGFHHPLVGPQTAVIMAWLLSSLIFGFLHIFNPNSTWVSTVALMLAGILLGLGYVLTGRLGLSIGLHITWNFFQGSIYGFRVSGNDLSNTSLLAIEQAGPQLWTGGAFGPEAGLIGIVAVLLGMILIGCWVQWQYGTLTIQRSLATYHKTRQSISTDKQGVFNHV